MLDDPAFVAGDLSTSFIDERPELLRGRESKDRGTKVLSWLVDTTVNKPNGENPLSVEPGSKLPVIDLAAPAPAGSRQRLRELGPAGFARALREQTALAVTETTFRDAHQSLLATRVRTRDLVRVAPYVARLTPGLLSVEAWGGATYDVALRFLGEDPWERLDALREALPNVAIQMLLRGRNTVGYTPYPTQVTDAFVAEAAASGVDIFRIFDALNDVAQMRPAIDAVLATGTAVAEVAVCYTGDLLDPAEDLYTLDYYLRLAEQIVDAGAHVLAVKDMAGLLRPAAAAKLVSALRERFDLPVHVHTHDTAGGQLATLLAASAAGADAVDAASAPLSGTTSQPSLSALVAALAHTERDTGLDLAAVSDLEPYWEAVRHLYGPFESGLPGPTGRVYHHEIPGGQLSNLRQQAIALGLADDFELIEDMYAAANRILGRVPKVTPSSKVVGDLALHLAAVKADPDDFERHPEKYDVPDSVVSFMAGELGDLPGGWPEPFRSKVLAGREVKSGVTPLSDDDLAALAGDSPTRRERLNTLLFPGPTRTFQDMRATYGDLSVLDTADYLYGLRAGEEHTVEIERGVQLFVGLEAIGDADDKGMRTVMTTLNGQLRPVFVRDRSIDVQARQAEKADTSKPGQVAAPFSGVVTLKAASGDRVAAGEVLVTLDDAVTHIALEQAKAARAAAELALTARDIDLKQARASLDRLESLASRDAASRQQLEESRTAFARASNAVSQARQDLATAELGIRSAEEPLAELTIRAPFAGTVTQINAHVGDTVLARADSVRENQSLLVITDTANLVIDADVAETNIASLRPGLRGEAVLDGFPNRAFAVEVVRLAPIASIEKGTITVRLALIDPPEGIRPNMAARIRIPLADMISQNGDSTP